MTKAEVDLGIEVIKYTFDKLPVQDRVRLIQDLERETRRQRWDPLICKVRARATKRPISQKEIISICDEVRQQLYAKRNKSSN